MNPASDNTVPQWKRDLIMRIRSKSKWPFDEQQLLAGTPRNSSAAVGRAGQQPSLTCSSAAVPVVNSSEDGTWKCNENSPTCIQLKMVKERVLTDHKQFNNFDNANDFHEENGDDDSVDSSSSEELHYGPGIVNRLKNRYLSLTLRENNVKARPSILPMRKATSLEHLLDDDVPNGKPALPNSRTFQSKWKENARNASNRYYNATRGSDLKRARSVETISRGDDPPNEELVSEVRLKHKSLHEEMLIVEEGSDKLSGKMYDNKILEITETKLFSNAVPHIINRPKRITPIMSEKEKPPVDVVKQTKKIFEGRAEQRTKPPHQTGEVAAKVATYKNIIGQTRNNKKPPLPKQKPIVTQDNNRRPTVACENSKLAKPTKLPLNNSENGWLTEEKSPSPDVASVRPLSSPIPDISRINAPSREDFCNNHQTKTGSLSETPDLILHSSPIKNAYSPTFRILATDNFLKAEITHASSNSFKIKFDQQELDKKPKAPSAETEHDGVKSVSVESRNKIGQAGNTVTYNLSSASAPTPRSHLPTINKEIRTNLKSIAPQPAKGSHTNKVTEKTAANSQLSPTSPSKAPSPTLSPLTPQEIEKNSINTAKTLEQSVVLSTPVTVKCSSAEVKKVEVPKTSLLREQKEQNSIVFKFTDRKDVPDYVGNDGRIRTGKIEKPKVGEGGIILLPGASLDESVTDDDDDWMLSLEGPPSPCDVMFVNDNVLIDGRSSLSQKSRKTKMKIKFVESVPEIFEYPSEASLMDDFPTTSRETSPGHVVPTLSGSSLANYIPKSGSTEDFQLGITRALPTSPVLAETKSDEDLTDSSLLQEIEEPILFSAGTNADILF